MIAEARNVDARLVGASMIVWPGFAVISTPSIVNVILIAHSKNPCRRCRTGASPACARRRWPTGYRMSPDPVLDGLTIAE
jgi:hypothetical protein